jgi:hypothetical protein
MGGTIALHDLTIAPRVLRKRAVRSIEAIVLPNEASSIPKEVSIESTGLLHRTRRALRKTIRISFAAIEN